VKNELRKRLFGIAGRYLGEEPLHGLPHIARVHKNFQLLCRNLQRDPGSMLLEAAESAVILHDIGHSKAGEGQPYTSHAVASAETIRTELSDELSDIPKWQLHWIIYAVANHSTGLPEKKILISEDLCLSLLVISDHLDNLGAVGITRHIMWCQLKNIPMFPKKEDLEGILALLTSDERPPLNEDWRWRSTINALLYIYYATPEIMGPMRDLIAPKFYNMVWEKNLFIQRFVWHFLLENSIP
jgi:hypothetical protein